MELLRGRNKRPFFKTTSFVLCVRPHGEGPFLVGHRTHRLFISVPGQEQKQLRAYVLSVYIAKSLIKNCCSRFVKWILGLRARTLSCGSEEKPPNSYFSCFSRKLLVTIIKKRTRKQGSFSKNVVLCKEQQAPYYVVYSQTDMFQPCSF